jgi:hypothetical protein
VTHDTRIGECDACHARFKVPASFRADRARCRECGGVVVLEHARPVPRPPLEKSRKSKPVNPGARAMEEAAATSSTSGASSRPHAHEPHRAEVRAAEHATSAPHHAARAPSHTGAKAPAERAEPAQADEKRAHASVKDAKKSGGVLGSIVAAAKAAVWRKKRGK